MGKGIHHFLHHNLCVLVIFAVFVAPLLGLHRNTFRKENTLLPNYYYLNTEIKKFSGRHSFAFPEILVRLLSEGKNLCPLTDKALVVLAAKIYQSAKVHWAVKIMVKSELYI